MKKNIATITISWFFIALFLYTGIEKLMDHRLFIEQLSNGPFPKSLHGIIAWATIVSELLIPILLFRSTTRLKGLYTSLVLLLLFTAYYLITVGNNPFGSCSCGGIIEDLSIKQHLIFNVGCIILSLFAIMEIIVHTKPVWLIRLSRTSIAVTICAIILVVFLSLRKSSDQSTGMEGKPIAATNVTLINDSTQINLKDLPAGNPIIVIEVSPFCPHCRAEINDIVEHIDYFSNTHIYLLTAFRYQDMKSMYDELNLSKYPVIRVGIDKGGTFLSYNKASVVPFTAVYNNQKNLLLGISGKTDISHLIRLVRN